MAPVVLAPVLDLPAAGPLAAALLERRGAPLVIDASAVERLGGQCLQVLLAAHATWHCDGKAFRINPAATAFTDAVSGFGATGLLAAS